MAQEPDNGWETTKTLRADSGRRAQTSNKESQTGINISQQKFPRVKFSLATAACPPSLD